MIHHFNLRLAKVSELFIPIRQAVMAKPAPHEFAQPSIWSEWQKKPGAILCLRPSDKQGLSLSVLHDVFRNFPLMANRPLPQTDEGARFLKMATHLFDLMGNRFEDDGQRGKAFQTCLGGTFTWRAERPRTVHVLSELRTGACIMEEGVLSVIREDKAEIGEGDDAYMQACRAYQIYAKSLDSTGPIFREGAPTFIVTIQDV